MDSALAAGKQLAEAGYSLRVIDVETTYDICQARISQRWRNSYEEALHCNDELGGRWVPSDFAREVFSGPDGTSLSAHAADRLAHEITAVTSIQRYWVDDIAAAPKLTNHKTRASPDAVLKDIDE